MGIKRPKCQTDNPDTQKFCGECATPLPSSKQIPVTETLETPEEELSTGSIFAGRYQIIEELGKGGMGKVYRVLDKELKEEVALKLIKPEIAIDEKTLERFSLTRRKRRYYYEVEDWLVSFGIDQTLGQNLVKCSNLSQEKVLDEPEG